MRRTDQIPEAPARPAGMGDLEFARLLAGLGPFVRDRYGVTLAFSQAHAARLLTTDETRQAEVEALTAQGIDDGPLHAFMSNSLLFANGARHAARRTPLARAFAFPVMAALRPTIRAAADALASPLVGAGEIDFLAAMANPLPARLIADLVGAPPDDAPRFTRLVYSAARGLSIRSPEVVAAAARDMQALADYVAALIGARRARPREDFLTAYLARTADGDLTEDEILMQIVTVIIAGSDTTRISLAAGFGRLLANPDQWTALCADPDARAAGAVSEILRYEPAVGSLARVVVTDMEIDGVRLPAGTFAAPLLIVTLRDPQVYAEPDRFDVARTDHPRWHPAFGAGPHRCLGEALARAELEEALAVLARLAPASELAGPPATLRGFGAIRGVDGLRVRLAAA